MLETEYNEAEIMELFKEDGRREGRELGREETADKLNRLVSILISSDRLDDLKRSTMDKAYQQQLMKELNI